MDWGIPDWLTVLLGGIGVACAALFLFSGSDEHDEPDGGR